MTHRAVRRPPRAHWFALAVVLVTVAGLLLVAGIVGGAVGEGDHQPRAGGRPAPESVLDGGPVLDPAHPDRPGQRVSGRTIALTFDDGPAPWTPAVLDVLEREHVPATFFVIGSNVTARPDLVERMRQDGDEVGVHTFTHPDIGSVPGWRERLEIDATQLVIASAAGAKTDLLRPPFSSEPDAETEPELAAIARAEDYRVVLADADTEDWRRPGVPAIVHAATSSTSGTGGRIVMLHDGGGDRSQTVAALRELIPQLKAQGYRFATVTGAVGLPSAWQPASAGDRWRGRIITWVVQAARLLAQLLTVLFVVAAVLAVLRLVVLLSMARRHVRRPPPDSDYAPAVSVVMPAYNEAVGIAAAVRSVAASRYDPLEVIVVDDGSTDDTAAIVGELETELPRVRLIRQPNAGKAAALNTGIEAARSDVLVMVDGDTVFEPDTVSLLVKPLADPGVGAVSGNTKVGNRGGVIGRWQHIEYVVGFNLDRRMYDVLECMPTVPGAIGAFRREALDQVGGVSEDTLAEDTDLTMAICRAGWRVVYTGQARAWTEAPASLGQLWRQRYRWCYGTLQSMWKHRHAVVERGAAGRLGRRGLLYLFLFQVLLPVIAPVVDVAAVYGLLFLSPLPIVLTWLGFLAVQYLSALYAFRLDGESPRPLWALALQQVVYRQLMYLVVLQSVAAAAYGIPLRWHKLRRTGDVSAATVSS